MIRKFFLLISFILFFLTGCSFDSLNPDIEIGEADSQLEGVRIEFTQETYQPSGNQFELRVLNNTSETISYVNEYIIEVLEHGSWREISPNDSVHFNMIAQVLEAGEETIEEINLEFYEPFKGGKYRLIKEIEEQSVGAEFEVEDILFNE